MTCNNYLCVTGDVNELKRFKEGCLPKKPDLADELFSFEGLVPNNGSAVKAWGTDSDADVFYVYDEVEHIFEVEFETSSPPIAWFEEVCRKFQLFILLKFYKTNFSNAGYYKYHPDEGIKFQIINQWCKEMVDFLYGDHEYGWGFGNICERCFQEKVALEDIHFLKKVICRKCYNNALSKEALRKNGVKCLNV